MHFRWVVVSKAPRLRHIRGVGFWILCGLALLLIITPAAAIVISVLVKAAPALKWTLLTNTTQNIQNPGLQNAILGTLVLSLGVVLVAGPIGILGGIYLAEFAPKRLGGTLRFFSEVLAGVPVGSALGLAALAAITALGGAASIRRRK